MELVSSRNIEEMVLVLKKEVAKTHNVVEHEDTGKYRQLLVRTLHSCCIKVSCCSFHFTGFTYNVIVCRFTHYILSLQFPDVAATVIPVLIEFLSDTNELAASDVLIFVREAIQKFEGLRPLIIEV
jgi:coatomer subunit beta